MQNMVVIVVSTVFNLLQLSLYFALDSIHNSFHYVMQLNHYQKHHCMIDFFAFENTCMQVPELEPSKSKVSVTGVSLGGYGKYGH